LPAKTNATTMAATLKTVAGEQGQSRLRGHHRAAQQPVTTA